MADLLPIRPETQMTDETPPRVPPATVALERLLRERMRFGNNLLNLDFQERWGSVAQKARAAREARELDVEAKRVAAELAKLSRETRAREPEAIEAWAAAHIELLDRFMADTDDDTARSVARRERAEWKEVAAGKLSYVKRNVFYVGYDEELARQLFGLPG